MFNDKLHLVHINAMLFALFIDESGAVREVARPLSMMVEGIFGFVGRF